jgi:oligopeptide/dipeptide ABC transporter ATP-binding protein
MTVEVATRPLLEVRGLMVGFPASDGIVLAANDVSFVVRQGMTLGLVGESGCGKSVTLRALIGLVPYPGEVIGGSIAWGSKDLRTAGRQELVDIRGSEISMIFQDPMACLNPVMSVGEQLMETLRAKLGMTGSEASARAIQLLDRVGIPAATKRLGDYPHQLSGGMRQRIMIALAIAPRPRLLLADEPTTALDVTIQDQILALLAEIRDDTGMAMILVSHDVGVVAQNADDIIVMYAGRILESGTTQEVLHAPRHPYTRGLLRAMPSIDVLRPKRLIPIMGQPPNLAALPPGCPFAPRCAFATEECRSVPV